ncbi:MAG: C25 family cysteine peptidase [Fidelibacterota bacterium]
MQNLKHCQNTYPKGSRIIVALAFIFAFSHAAGGADPTKVQSHFQSAAGMQLQFELGEYSVETITHQGVTYQRINGSMSGTVSREGEPQLPVYTTFYQVDPRKTYTISAVIRNKETLSNIHLIPVQSWVDPEIMDTKPLMKDVSLYNSQEVFPENIVTVSDVMTMRDVHVIRISLTPFRYIPGTGELEVITAATIEVTETGNNPNPDFTPGKIAREFEPLYRSLIANYDATRSELVEYQKPSILYILPGDGSGVLGNLEPLLNWRKRAGYVVNTVTTNETGGTASAIKSYILNAYTTWDNPPVWIALVGDANGSYSIPTFIESWSWYNGEGDHPYTELTGNDILPEVLVGRISISSTTDLINIVNKTVQYETNPYMGENWFTRAVLVGDPGSSGISTVITNQYIQQLLSYNGYDDLRTVYSSPFPSQMVSNLGDGATFFNYRGYYGVSGFDCGDVGAANNGFKLPIATVITCGTGSFTGTSISECFIRAGTVANPKGAVAAVGTATIGTHTMFNNIVDMGFYYGIFQNGMTTPSGALAQGQLELLRTYPSNPNNYVSIFTHWNNLMGDPAVRMWTAVPQYLSVGYLPVISKGTNFIDVHVQLTSGNSVAGAYVTLFQATTGYSESAWTDENGNITIPIDTDLNGEILLTVIKNNHIPYQGSFLITEPGVSVNVLPAMVNITDDGSNGSVGNGDGIINPGETIALSVPAFNYGANASGDVYTRLITNSPYVNLIQDSVHIGVVSAGTSVVGSDYFLIQVNNGLVDGTDLGLRYDFIDPDNGTWQGNVGGLISGANISPRTIAVNDNGDGILQPGETSEIQITLKNGGSILAGNVYATITCSNPDIEILDNYGSWGDMYAGQMSNNSADEFTIYAAEGIIPGTIAHITMSINGDNGVHFSGLIDLMIGDPQVSDPVGPDEHGYYIYDSGDLLYAVAPYYNWIEIDDRYGGDGNYLSNLVDGGNNGDATVTVPLPFTFRMYGEEYSTISICSNGWISMGSTAMRSFRNYRVPGPGGPSPIIAGFWDDLTTTGNGRVYTKYDNSGHRFIVQWSRVRTYDKNDTETFQIILRDPQFYFTPTGDGEIVVQYHTYNNTSSGNSSAQAHGNYATIGIEDQSGQIGLQYTYQNQYANAAMPLSGGTSILITTRGSSIRMRGDVTQDNIVDLYDILTLVDYILADEVGYLNPYLADINGDGNVNILDVIGMVQSIMNY